MRMWNEYRDEMIDCSFLINYTNERRKDNFKVSIVINLESFYIFWKKITMDIKISKPVVTVQVITQLHANKQSKLPY